MDEIDADLVRNSLKARQTAQMLMATRTNSSAPNCRRPAQPSTSTTVWLSTGFPWRTLARDHVLTPLQPELRRC